MPYARSNPGVYYNPPKPGTYLVFVQKSNYDNQLYLTKSQAEDVELKMNLDPDARPYTEIGDICYDFQHLYESIEYTIDDDAYRFVRKIASDLRFV